MQLHTILQNDNETPVPRDVHRHRPRGARARKVGVGGTRLVNADPKAMPKLPYASNELHVVVEPAQTGTFQSVLNQTLRPGPRCLKSACIRVSMAVLVAKAM